MFTLALDWNAMNLGNHMLKCIFLSLGMNGLLLTLFPLFNEDLCSSLCEKTKLCYQITNIKHYIRLSYHNMLEIYM